VLFSAQIEGEGIEMKDKSKGWVVVLVSSVLAAALFLPGTALAQDAGVPVGPPEAPVTAASPSDEVLDACVTQCMSANSASQERDRYRRAFCSGVSFSSPTPVNMASVCFRRLDPNNPRSAFQFPACAILSARLAAGGAFLNVLCGGVTTTAVAAASASRPFVSSPRASSSSSEPTVARAEPRVRPGDCARTQCADLEGENRTACMACCASGGARWYRDAMPDATSISAITGASESTLRCVRRGTDVTLALAVNGLVRRTAELSSTVLEHTSALTAAQGDLRLVQSQLNNRTGRMGVIMAGQYASINVMQAQLERDEAQIDLLRCLLTRRLDGAEELLRRGAPSNATVDMAAVNRLCAPTAQRLEFTQQAFTQARENAPTTIPNPAQIQAEESALQGVSRACASRNSERCDEAINLAAGIISPDDPVNGIARLRSALAQSDVPASNRVSDMAPLVAPWAANSQ